MQRRKCIGRVVFPLGDSRRAICNLTHSKNKFFQARAKIILPLSDGHIPHAQTEKWVVGRFYCNTPGHDVADHQYQLIAYDEGVIEVYGEEDSIILRVRVYHKTEKDEDRPSVRG